MPAWMPISVNLSALRNSSKPSKISHRLQKTQITFWHRSCSTTSRRCTMKRIAVLLVVICILPALVYAQAIAYDYSKLYEALSPAVVQITTQDGSGSGFRSEERRVGNECR